MSVLSLSTAATAVSLASYAGRIGNARIELQLAAMSSGTGVYIYSKIGTPIALRSSLHHGVLTLTEYAANRLITTRNFGTTKYKPIATLTIPAFSFGAPALRGTWRNLATGHQLPLRLTLITGSNDAGRAAVSPSALQIESLPTCYFMTLLSGKFSDPSTRVRAVQVVEKKTNRVLQQFPVSCRSIGQGSVSVDDYNFDGVLDFSIYEDDGNDTRLAAWGHNNSLSHYFLCDPVTKAFTVSRFQGTGLEFDAKRKRVYEYTFSRTREAMIKTEYRVVNNQLVLVIKHCLEWHPHQGFTVSEPSACQ